MTRRSAGPLLSHRFPLSFRAIIWLGFECVPQGLVLRLGPQCGSTTFKREVL
jgi:hypothetical protein